MQTLSIIVITVNLLSLGSLLLDAKARCGAKVTSIIILAPSVALAIAILTGR